MKISLRCSKAEGVGREFMPIGLVNWNCSTEEKQKAQEGPSHVGFPLKKGLLELGTPQSLHRVRKARAFPCSLLPGPPTSPSGADLPVRPQYQALGKGRISMKAEEGESK